MKIAGLIAKIQNDLIINDRQSMNCKEITYEARLFNYST